MVTVRFKTLITGLKERCGERLTNGLRRFIASDNYSAAEVGLLRRGQRPFKVARPKINGDRSEVLRERAVDSTLRTEEFDMVKACINVDHIEKMGTALGGRRLVSILPGSYKGIEGSEWEELCHYYREMNKAAGAKKPCESQKAKGAVGYEGSPRQER